MSLKGFIIRRTIYIVPVMLGITLMNFTLINVSPGDPVIVRIGLLQCNSPECYNNAYNREAVEMGLLGQDYYTIPWFNRYVDFVNDLLHFNLGKSWYYTQAGEGIPIAQIIKERAVYTVVLNVLSFFFSLLLATAIGVVSATRQNSFWDRSLTVAMLLGYSMPLFWLAKLLMLLSFQLFNFTGVANKEAFKKPLFLNPNFYKYLILPTLALTLGGLVFMARLVRSQLLEILRQDYITTAKAKGLDNRAVIYKHAFRNGLLPIVTIIGNSLPGLLAGSVMIEAVFGWPGLGTVFLEGALFRDYPMMMATNTIFPLLFLVARLLTDITYVFIDPRIKY
ncbi:MAG: ABC transporter permease [Candidatus Heimdallarchaeota archaeon]|nr:ABC transporter permease [Candidatus Heimdallarchaeota archaeon]MCG3256890.1 ABC transporter permease [Candidatus Heimdallarchaeota archaeon]MCK4611954.1 ABC transporter permease [Candidatus Heimdallarchaeota archaeon]